MAGKDNGPSWQPKTMADLRGMSADEINAHWDTVSAILKTGKAPAVRAEPETIEDLKTLSQEDVIKHWPKVCQILEGQAKAERAAKLERAKAEQAKAVR